MPTTVYCRVAGSIDHPELFGTAPEIAETPEQRCHRRRPVANERRFATACRHAPTWTTWIRVIGIDIDSVSGIPSELARPCCTPHDIADVIGYEQGAGCIENHADRSTPGIAVLVKKAGQHVLDGAIR